MREFSEVTIRLQKSYLHTSCIICVKLRYFLMIICVRMIFKAHSLKIIFCMNAYVLHIIHRCTAYVKLVSTELTLLRLRVTQKIKIFIHFVFNYESI